MINDQLKMTNDQIMTNKQKSKPSPKVTTQNTDLLHPSPSGRGKEGEGIGTWILKIGIYLFLVSCILIFCQPAYAATSLDPALKWKTIETHHFSITYYEEIEHLARKLAPIAEEVHLKISSLFRHTPDIKTQVLLLDNTDQANEFTSVMPNPSITIYVSDMGSSLKPYAYEDWFRYVFTHEYVHVIHLDMVEGGPRIFKFLFGRSFFPNQIEPMFIIEGMATYFEGQYAKGGRGQDPRFDAMMRMDILENNMKSIDQAAVYTSRWPGGHLCYLYGEKFMAYLASLKGDESLVRLAQEYGDAFFSYGIDGAFRSIWGKPLWVLWREWEDNMRDFYEAQRKEIEKEPLTEPRIITDTGYYNLIPRFTPDSKYIVYVQVNQDSFSNIRKINVETEAQEELLEGMLFDDSMTILGDKLYFSKYDIYKNFYLYKDIFIYDLKTKGIHRLTYGGRMTDPCISPDGKKLVYVHNAKGRRTLWIMDIDGKNHRQLGEDSIDVQYMSPRFSPDGKYIVVSKWKPGGQSIYLIVLRSGKEYPLLPNSTHLEANPSFSPDGEYILFDSDRFGVPNLYARSFRKNKLYKITNVLGMAIMPQVSPDSKKIAYINYTSDGYNIALIDYAPYLWEEVDFEGLQPPEVYYEPVSPEAVILSKHDYRFMPSLFPKFWAPLSYENENGRHFMAYTAGIDTLGQHLFGLQAGMDWTSRRPSYSLSYANNQYLPQISVSFSDFAVPYSWESDQTYWERQQTGGIFFSLFNNRAWTEYDKAAVSVGYEIVSLSNVSTIETYTTKPNLGNLRALVLASRYYNLRASGRAISPERGIDVSAYVYLYSKELASDYNITNFIVYGNAYTKMPLKHHVLALLTQGIVSRGERLEQTGFSWRYLNMRGYPSTALAGSKGAMGKLEYRFPISYIEDGIGYGYIFANKFYGAFFFDYGGITDGAVSSIDWKRSIGTEYVFETNNMWGMVPLNFKFGWAKGLDAGGEEEFYLQFVL